MDANLADSNRALLRDALDVFSTTSDDKIRAHTGAWLISYLEAGNPVPDSFDTQLELKKIRALRDLGYPKPTKARRPRKTRSDKGKSRKGTP